MVNLFLEASTRTRISFELAAKRLSADVLNISPDSSSLSKGESLLDTARNIEAMRADFIVIRHTASGAPWLLGQFLKSSVVNAGDGTHEHPTQALLDLFTIKEKLKRIEGLKVVIVGDISHSRVARSDILALRKMGAEVCLSGPPTMIPLGIDRFGVEVEYNLDRALKGRDVIIMLRLQLERQIRCLFPSLREYSRLYGLTRERLKLAKEHALVMHPGPVNRGIEISPSIADGLSSVILDQVTNGIAVRMAVLYLLSGGKET